MADYNREAMDAVLKRAVENEKYSEYELSDVHIRALFSYRKPYLFEKLREKHFDTWLAEHDRRVKESAYAEGFRDGNGYVEGTSLDEVGNPFTNLNNRLNEEKDA